MIDQRATGFLLATLLACAGTASRTHAQTPDDLCRDRGIVIGFFNGVQTTRRQASFALDALEVAFGTASPNGEPIRGAL